MARRSVHGAPAEVRAVRQQFERWRTTRQPGKGIPQPLWNLALRLADVHGLNRVARWLRLNATRLRDHVPRHSDQPPTFVEGTVPAGFVLGAPTAEYALDLGPPDTDTLRIRVRGATVAEIAALADALRPGPRPR
jgi:hypothetical protein